MAANTALTQHLSNYHPDYVRWLRKSWSRLVAIFPAMLVVDAILVLPGRNNQALAGSLSWPIVAVVVALEFLGGIWLMRTLYYRRVRRLRLEWQEHPTPTVLDGEVLEREASSTRSLDSSLSFAEPDERYQGGLYSIQIGLGRGRNQTAGYGIYITQ